MRVSALIDPRRSTLAVVATLAVSISLLVVLPSAPAQAYRAPVGAHFNEPRPWGTVADRYRIINTIQKAIRNTRPTKGDPHPVINLTSFLFDRPGTVDTVIAACRRGVAIRVVLDEDGTGEDYTGLNGPQRRLISALNGDNVRDPDRDGRANSKPRTGRCGRPLGPAHRSRFGPQVSAKMTTDGSGTVMMSRTAAAYSLTVPNAASVTWGRDGSYVRRCSGSCRGTGGNMHSKFYLFSHTGRSKDVVMVSSSNLNQGGANLGWNDVYVMANRPKSYNYYKRVHRAMTDDLKALGKQYEVVDGPFISRFFPMKGAGKQTDPTWRELNKVRCSSDLGPTQIYVSMFFWAGTRGNYMLDRLLALARQGCKVNVIVGAPSGGVIKRLSAASKSGLINAYDSRWNWDADTEEEVEPDVRTHEKFVLVRGNYDGNRKSYQVWTGTGNWVGGSLNLGDENSLNIALKSAFDAYVGNWRVVRNHSRHLPQAPGSSCPRCE